MEILAYKVLLKQVCCVTGTARAGRALFLSCSVEVLHYFYERLMYDELGNFLLLGKMLRISFEYPWYLHGKIQCIPGKSCCTLEVPFKMYVGLFKNTFKLLKMYYTNKQKNKISLTILPVVFLPGTRNKHAKLASCLHFPVQYLWSPL